MYRIVITEEEVLLRKQLVYSVPWAEMDCCVVGEAGDGKTGEIEIRKKMPDIVMTDITLPEMDGLNMLERTKEIPYSSIILTGREDFDQARRAIDAGVRAYLLKPLKPEELKRAVEQAKEDRRRKELDVAGQNGEIRYPSSLRWRGRHRTEQDLVRQLLTYIEENYQKKIRMQDILEAFHYSETFINKRFKEVTGNTFNEYLNRYRIRKAMELMRREGIRIRDVAWQCGFSDYKYFGVVFRKYIGCSPKEFQKSVS